MQIRPWLYPTPRPLRRSRSPYDPSCNSARPAERYYEAMCRNIRPLFNFDPPVTEDEIRAASLQFVRKISGFSKPSKSNEAAFQDAVDEIAGISARERR